MHQLLALFKEFCLKNGVADNVYIVGGAVRDMLSGIETKDIDLAFAGDALLISQEFAQASGGSFVLLDSTFGIARVVKDSVFLDISAMRGDSIAADLADRDITINAMAIPLCEWESKSRVIDPFGGQEDLKSRTIRMVSEKNIISDPLRTLRIYRFSAALHASIENNTRRALKNHNALLRNVAIERIAEELRHITAFGDSYEMIKTMEEDNIMAVLFPEFLNAAGISIKQGIASYRQCEGIIGDPLHYFPFSSESILAYFDLPERRTCLKLAALFSGTAYALEASLRLKMSTKETKLVASIISGYAHILSLAAIGAGKTEMVRFLKVAQDNVYPIVVLAAAAGGTHQYHGGRGILLPDNRVLFFYNEILSLYLDEFLPRMRLLKIITGKDLIEEFGLPPSPQFKSILSELEDDILEGKVKTRAEALSAVRIMLARL